MAYMVMGKSGPLGRDMTLKQAEDLASVAGGTVTEQLTVLRFRGEYRFLSNFWESEFRAPWFNAHDQSELNWWTWKTNEHYFQAAKTTNAVQAIKIQNQPTPALAKMMGGPKRCQLQDGWDDGLKIQAMWHGLTWKFSDPWLIDKLMDTYPHKLQEGNNHGDRYWGRIWDPVGSKWTGANMLGRLLETMRETLREECGWPILATPTR